MVFRCRVLARPHLVVNRIRTDFRPHAGEQSLSGVNHVRHVHQLSITLGLEVISLLYYCPFEAHKTSTLVLCMTLTSEFLCGRFGPIAPPPASANRPP